MRKLTKIFAMILFAACACAQSVNFHLTTDHGSYVVGERIQFTVRIINKGVAPIIISDFDLYKDNRLNIEIINQDKQIVKAYREGQIVKELSLEKDAGEIISVNLTEWYHLNPGHYQIRVQLTCNGYRYDSPIQVFDVVPGFDLASTVHYVSLRPSIERTLRLVYWAREGREIAFLRADDSPQSSFCRSIMLGDIMRVKTPSIERVKGKENCFYIYRQTTKNILTRTEIISDTDGIRVVDTKRKMETASAPVIESLKEAVQKNEK